MIIEAIGKEKTKQKHEFKGIGYVIWNEWMRVVNFFLFCILEFELLLINLFTNFIMRCIVNIRQMFKQPENEAFSLDSTG